MKIKSSLISLAVASAVAAVPAHAMQISVNDDALGLASALTLNQTTGITVTQAQLIYGDAGYSGGEIPAVLSALAGGTPSGLYSSGQYTNANATYGLPGPGIVLSTGNVLDYASGANLEEFKTSSLGNTATAAQNVLLDPVTGSGSTHYDVTQLNIKFDVAANTSSVSFLAVFGSEEYPQYVGSSFNDGFGLYLNGVNIAGVIPTGGGTAQTVSINHPDMQPISGTELNGVLAPNGNPVLRFDAAVVPGSTGNVLTVILGDRADSALDTTVYLASLGAVGGSPSIPVMPSNGQPDANGAFQFDISVGSTGLGLSTPIWVDPVVAVGYTYKVNSGPDFASVVLPSLSYVNDTDGYELWVYDGTKYVFVRKLAAGESYTFGTDVDEFQIRDIDPLLGLNPSDAVAFPVGLTFDGPGQVQMSMTALTADTNAVPVPGTLGLMGIGAAGLAGLRRRKS